MSTVDCSSELLFVGDDWAEEHHDIELMDQAGRVLAPSQAARRRRGHRPAARDDRRGRGRADRRGRDRDRTRPVGAGADRSRLRVHAVNPLQAARYRERHSVSGAKSDTKDARFRAHRSTLTMLSATFAAVPVGLLPRSSTAAAAARRLGGRRGRRRRAR
jgi:hypothetical protein